LELVGVVGDGSTTVAAKKDSILTSRFSGDNGGVSIEEGRAVLPRMEGRMTNLQPYGTVQKKGRRGGWRRGNFQVEGSTSRGGVRPFPGHSGGRECRLTEKEGWK